MHEDDLRMIRRLAINRASACLQSDTPQDSFEANMWFGVAVIAGADKDDLCAALQVTQAFADLAVERIREETE